jgi:hypothetical protein
MEYNKKKMREELVKLSDELEGHEKAAIAGAEQVSFVTVSTYLKGTITVPSLAKAIIERGKLIIKNREK